MQSSSKTQALLRAQGTVEYLVVVAVVVVLSLVVVGVVVTQTQSGANVSSTASEISSKTGLLAISNVSLNAVDKNYFVSLKNNDAESITVTSVKVSSDLNAYSEQLNMTSEKVFKVATLSSCTSGQKGSATVTVGYTTKYGLSKSQVFSNLVVNCEVISVNPSMLAGNTGQTQIVGSSDVTPPVIALSLPVANAVINYFDQNVVFTFSADETIGDCNLYIKTGSNWALADSNSVSVGASVTKQIDANLAAFGVGDHYWDVNCLDTNGNKGSATDQNITYVIPYNSQLRNVYFSTGSDFNFGNYFLNTAVINPPIKPMGEIDWNVNDRGVEISSSDPLNDANLFGLWHLNGNSTDSKGTLGSLTWGGTEAYTTGLFNSQAASMNGSSYAQTPNVTFESTKDYSISFWFIQEDTSPNATNLFGFYNTGVSGGFQSGISTNGGVLNSGICRTWIYCTGSTVNPIVVKNVWHHITIVYEKNLTQKVYYDGKFLETIALGSAGLNVTVKLPIGTAGLNGSEGGFLKGKIEEFAYWTRALSLTDVQTLYKSQKGNWLDNNLVAYYKFNSKYDTNKIIDSARGNTGTLTNGPDTNAQGLWDTNAGYFDGVNDYVDLTNSSIFNPTSAMTISAWIYPKSYTNCYPLGGSLECWVVGRDISGGRSYAFGFTNPTLTLQVNGTNTVTYAYSNIATNKWHHILVTGEATGNFIKLYVDGVLVDTKTWTAPASTSTITTIGRRMYSGAEGYFNGYIEDVKLYNRSLSAAEVAADFNRGLIDSNYVSRVLDSSPSSVVTDYNYLILNSNNGLDKNGHIYGAQIEPTVEKDLNVGLVGLWHLNGDVNDSSVYRNNGTPSNLTYTTGLWGNQSGSFNGSSSIATFLGPNLNGDSSYTLSYWINPSQYKDDSCSICFGATGVSSGSICTPMCNGGTYVCVAHYGNDHQFLQTYKLNQWQHVVLAYDSSTSTEKMYYNGVFSESWTPADLALSSSRQLVFGRWQWASNPTNFFNGAVEEVAIWNRALDANSIKEIFNKGATKIGAKYRGCVDSTCSANPAWSALTYPDSNSRISLDKIDGNRYFQYVLYPTLYTFPDGNVFSQAFASIRDVNVLYTN